MQQRIIIKILDEGLKKMTMAQDSLYKASSGFNKAYGRITVLTAQLNTDFDPKGDFMKELVKRKFDAERKKPCTDWYCDNIAYLIAKVLGIMATEVENVKRYHEELKNALNLADAKIDETKAKLQHEITAIGDVKSQAMVTLTTIDDIIDFDALDVEIETEIKTVMKDLIEESRQYREQHNNAKETFF